MNLEKAELFARKQNQVLGQPAEMHHRHRAGVQECGDEVPIARDVDAVRGVTAEPEPRGQPRHVYVVGRAGDCARAERHHVGLRTRDVKASHVPAEGRRVRQEHVGDEHGLGTTKMRVRRHHGRAGRRRLMRECRNQISHRHLDGRNPALEVQTEIERHLLVPRPAGVEPAPGIADALDEFAFDERVDILVWRVANDPGARPNVAPDGLEAAANGVGVGRRQHPGAAEGGRPGFAPGQVVFDEPTDPRAGTCRSRRRARRAARKIGRTRGAT